MSLINLNLAILAYQDGPKTNQPRLRLADLQWSLQGIPTQNFKNIPISLAPGELLTVATTARTLTFNSSTQFQMSKVGSDRMRIKAAIGQRAGRSYGDSTTQWTITRDGSITHVESTDGTAPDFSTIRAGDFAYFGPTYSPFNQGEFQIVKVGSNYFEFINPTGTAEGPIVADLNIYSTGPVQRGDILDITSPAFAMYNQGQFPVVAATDTFIEVLNQDAFPETVTSVSSGIQIYPFSFKWMAVAIDHRIVVGLNGEAPTQLEVEPPVEGDLTNSPGLFVKRGKVFEVRILNPTLQQAQGFLLLAE